MYVTEVSFTCGWKFTIALVLEVSSSPLGLICNKHIKDYIEILPTRLFLLKKRHDPASI